MADADVVVHALAPRGELEGKLQGVAGAVAERADRAGIRLAVVGGAGSLLVAPNGPKLVDLPDAPAEFKPEGRAMDDILQQLRAAPETLDWFYVTPAPAFGPWAEAAATGTYRVGGDVLIPDENGRATISGADFAKAVVDEVEEPAHRRQRFLVIS